MALLDITGRRGPWSFDVSMLQEEECKDREAGVGGWVHTLIETGRGGGIRVSGGKESGKGITFEMK